MPASFSKKSASAAKWAAIAIGASVPISVALDNTLMLAVLFLWMAGGNFKEKLEIIRGNRVAVLSLSLLGWLAIGMFYGQTSLHDAFGTFGKYIDLLFVPIFITLFRDTRARTLALHAFVFSMLLTLCLSFALKFGMLHQNAIVRGFSSNPYVFKLHITQNFFMSFVAMILATWSLLANNTNRRIIWGVLALFALIDVLFMVQGRIGYIVLTLLLLYLFIRKLGTRGLLAGLAAALLLGSLAYSGSSEFRSRIDIAATEFANWHEGQATKDSNSIGQRLEYYSNTLGIIREHPVFGVGTGGFEKAYAARVANTKMLPTRNPHNEFLLVTAQTGLPGLLLLILLFLVMWREAKKLPPQENMLAHGLVIAMVSGCLFNSFLLDHAEGLFFAFMTGTLFSARAEN